MYLFSRTGRLAPGQLVAGMAWATQITEKAKEISGRDIRLWDTVFSPGLGRIVWSTFAEDLESLERMNDAMLADPAYLALVKAAADVTTGTFDDRLSQILYGQPDLKRDVEYVSIVNAVCAVGQYSRGIQAGIEIAQYAEKVTGEATMFALSMTGPYGSVMWLTPNADIGSLERGNTALNSDPGWVELVDRETAGAYAEEPVVTQQTIYRNVM